VEHDHNNDNLRLWHPAIAVVITLPSIFGLVKASTAEHCVKNLAEFIRNYEILIKFAHGFEIMYLIF